MIRKTFTGLIFLIFMNVELEAQTKLQYSSFNSLYGEIIEDKAHITVLNFWATWCKPCVAELPDFEKLNLDFHVKGVRVVLGNLDFHSKTDSLIPPFIIKKGLKSEVIHITDQDPNDWINQVDNSWSGTIPATAIYFKGKKVWFVEGQTDYEILKSIIIKYIEQ